MIVNITIVEPVSSRPTFSGNVIVKVKSASYPDLHLRIDGKEKLLTKFYDKRNDFLFRIVNFPFIGGNIHSALAYGVFISQLIRYARAFRNYTDIL